MNTYFVASSKRVVASLRWKIMNSAAVRSSEKYRSWNFKCLHAGHIYVMYAYYIFSNVYSVKKVLSKSTKIGQIIITNEVK